MARAELGPVVRGIAALFSSGTATGLTDVELLERFAERADDPLKAEAAFAVLVKRHGPMVLRVCRGELRDQHAAEDAFQATFLVLARKANSIRRGGSLASWLYGVARRIARRSGRERARRAEHERAAGRRAAVPFVEPSEWMSEVQEEVDRLPEKYRAAVLLCYLEGHTHEEAAGQLRVPVGTVKTRLARGRKRLKARLEHRGLAPAIVAATLTTAARGAVPVSLFDATLKAVAAPAAGAAVSMAVAVLARGALRTMFFSQLRHAAALAAASITFVASTTIVVSAWPGPDPDPKKPDPPRFARPTERTTKPAPALARAGPPQKPDPGQKEKDQKPALGPTFTVKKTAFHRTTDQPGTVEPFERVELYPKVSGELAELKVDIGDTVQKGQVVATINAPELKSEAAHAQAVLVQYMARGDSAKSKVVVAETGVKTARLQVEKALAETASAESQQKYREKQRDRIAKLAERHAVEENLVAEEDDRVRAAKAVTLAAQSGVLVAKSNLNGAGSRLRAARVEAAEAQADIEPVRVDLMKARDALKACEVVSPIDGVITLRNYHRGEIARTAAMPGARPLFTIVRADKVRIVVLVPEFDVRLLDVGDPVMFQLDGEKYQGAISRAAFALDPSTRTMSAEIDLPNPKGRLRPGQLGRATIVLEDVPDSIVIPNSAVGREGKCILIKDGREFLRKISYEAYGGRDQVRVLSGLKEGDVIATDFDEADKPNAVSQ